MSDIAIEREFGNDEDYKNIKKEIQPYLDEILFTSGKAEPKYRTFAKEITEWNKRFELALRIAGKVLSIQRHEIKDGQVKLDPVIRMFLYLGIVESLGSSLFNMIILLLIACGKDFHVEGTRDFPTTFHAATVEDLESPSIGLTVKKRFLERCGLNTTAKLIDTCLRNKIAHLNLTENEIDTNGTISLNLQNNIRLKYNRFNRIWMFINFVLNDNQFWEKLKTIKPLEEYTDEELDRSIKVHESEIAKDEQTMYPNDGLKAAINMKKEWLQRLYKERERRRAMGIYSL